MSLQVIAGEAPALPVNDWPPTGIALGHLLLRILALIKSGQLHRIEQVLDLIFRENFLLTNYLQNPLPALVGFAGQLSRFFVTEHRVERGHNAYGRFDIPFEWLLVERDAIDTLCAKCN